MKKGLAWLISLCLLLAGGLPTALAETITITLSGDTATWNGRGVTQQGSVVTIGQGGEYTLQGSWNGQLLIDAPKGEDITLNLCGVTITNPEGAALLVEEAGDVTLKLEENTENRLISGEQVPISAETAADEDASGAALQAKCDLKIKGSGALFVGGYLHQGIRTSKDLTVKNGQITVEAVGSGIRCKDKLEIEGGSLTITSGGDGIHAASEATDTEAADGHAIISGGTLQIEALGDAIQSETTLLVSGGVLNLVTGGGSANAPTRQTGFFRGENWDMSDEEQTTSTKGLKASETLEVTGGALNMDSYDDGLHAAGAITVSGGALTIFSGDDGIHSDTSLLISGGTIDVQRSYEGLEAQEIDITDGDVQVTADDDGLNANGGESGFGGFGGFGGRGGRQGGFGGRGGMRPGEDATSQQEPPAMPDGTAPEAPSDGQAPEGMPEKPDEAPTQPEGMPEKPENIPDQSEGMPEPPATNNATPANTIAQTLPHLTISGGTVRVNAQGDGLDSNGDLLISGGVVLIDGPDNGGNGALDAGTESGGTLRVTGGTVLAIGASGMAECFDSTSTQAFISVNTRWNAGDTLLLTDADGTELLRHTAAKSGQSVIFSSPQLQEGATMKVHAGDTETEATAGFESTSGGFGGFGRHGW